jgi:phage protein D
MKQPYYRIFLGESKIELTDYVEQFKFEDCVEQDSLLEIRLSPPKPFEFAEEPSLLSGALVYFEFGFLGIENSGTRVARITDVSVKYSESVGITLKCLDKGTVMKKSSSCKVWKNKTTREIVTEIAGLYGMSVKCDIIGTTWKSLPQGHLSDFEFLQRIAINEGSGKYICYVSDTELRFEERGTAKTSKKTYTYGDPQGGVIAFEPVNAETTAKGISATAVGFDAKTKKPLTESSDRNNGTVLGKFVSVYDSQSKLKKIGLKDEILDNGRLPTDGIWSKVNGLEKRLVMPSAKKHVAASAAGTATGEGGLKQETATLTLEGDPTIRVNEVVTIAGVYKRHLGNWLSTKVTHSIANSGYLTKIELLKNGSKVGTEPAAKTNTTVGKESPDKKKLLLYDKDSELYERNPLKGIVE